MDGGGINISNPKKSKTGYLFQSQPLLVSLSNAEIFQSLFLLLLITRITLHCQDHYLLFLKEIFMDWSIVAIVYNLFFWRGPFVDNAAVF